MKINNYIIKDTAGSVRHLPNQWLHIVMDRTVYRYNIQIYYIISII